MILTSTMIKEDQKTSLNQQLLPYNTFLKELAKSKGCLFADLNTEMQQTLKTFPKDAPKGKQLTSDGVHMNAYGNIMMAKGVLKAFGLSDEALTTLEQDWKNTPGSHSIRLNISMSLNEYDQLQKKLGKSVQQTFQDSLEQKKKELLK